MTNTHDLHAIDEALRAAKGGRTGPALATVVAVRGSSYRQPGARMFVYPDGRRRGAVSGGCLEADVVAHAERVLRTDQLEYVLYDKAAANGDIVAELGCNGAVGVLVEPLTSRRACRGLELIAHAGAQRRCARMAIVYETSGTMQAGDRAIWIEGEMREDVTASGERLPVDLESAVAIEGMHVESILPPVALMVCGSGYDTAPLLEIGLTLGWDVTQHASPQRQLDGSSAHRDGVVAPTIPDARTAAVIMTHSYSCDLTWLRSLLGSSAAYIGLLGPRQRTERLLAVCLDEGAHLTTRDLERLHAPVGLDIGAETPEEIAVSIIAEIRAALAGRPGGSLRKRGLPIHDVKQAAVLVHRPLDYALV